MAKILGLGNALVDIMTVMEDDSLLQKYNLPKGSMQLIDMEMRKQILEGTHYLNKKQSAGGSAANTINGLANLGASTGFMGKIGQDEFGDLFTSELVRANISPLLSYSDNETGTSIALVSPDSERTMATYLGAAIELAENDIIESLFEGYTHFHIEGYLVQNHALIEKAMRIAKENNVCVAIDLASFNVVEENLDFLKRMVKDYADIVFANKEEAMSYTGKLPVDALDEIAQQCDIAIVKTGSEGSFIKKGSEFHNVDITQARLVDTTGAGDFYASGFLYGYMNNLPLDICGKIASLTAASVIEVIGAKLDDPVWHTIRARVEKIIAQK